MLSKLFLAFVFCSFYLQPEKIVSMFFSGIVLGGTTYCRLICLAESWKHFLKSKTAFVCFLIQRDTGKQHSDSTLSVLPFQYNTFMAWIASSCLLTASACAHSRLRLVLISSPELRFWLRSYRPRNTFFSPPEYAWVDLYYSFYRFDLEDGKVWVICALLFIIIKFLFMCIWLERRKSEIYYYVFIRKQDKEKNTKKVVGG